MVDIDINSREVGNKAIIEVKGEVDVYTAPKLKSRILDLIDNKEYNILIDLNGVEFMDSSGLGVLVGALKRVGPNKGKVDLVLNKPSILKIFKITGLDKVFEIYATVDDAFKGKK